MLSEVYLETDHGGPHEEDEDEKDKHGRLASTPSRAEVVPQPGSVEGPEKGRQEDSDDARSDEGEDGIARGHAASVEEEAVRPLVQAVVADRLFGGTVLA